MPTLQVILADAIHLLKEHPDWSVTQLLDALQKKTGITEVQARSMLTRARFTLDREYSRWCLCHRRRLKPLPGDTDPGFDNCIRVSEEIGFP